MKKIYLSILSILFTAGAANAQLSITKAANEAVDGDMYSRTGLDTSNAMPNSVTGNAAVWNVTGVSTNTNLATITYTAASAVPSAVNFVGSTLVQISSAQDTTFWKSGTNTFELVGLSNTQFYLNYSDPGVVAQYPINYNSSFSDAIAGDLIAQGQNGTFTGTVSTIADGSGTLNINALAPYTNCLRVKTVQNIDFTVGGFIPGTIEQTVYNYYHSSNKFPLLSIQYTHIIVSAFSIDQITSSVDLNDAVILGVNEAGKNNVIFTAYPNPASENVNLHFVTAKTENYHVDVVNTLGQTVKTIDFNNLQPGMYNENIDLSGLTKGIYFVKVKGKNAEGVQKIMIQ